MQYRKIKGNNIFDGYQFVGNDKVLVTQANGTIEAIIDQKDAGEEVQHLNGIICPGFVNAHCHIELSHLKNKIPQHTGLVDFILDILKLRTADVEIKQEAMRKAEEELYNSGTTAVGDICNTIDSIFLKKQSKLHWHNFIEVSGFNEDFASKRFEDVKNVQQQFNNETTCLTAVRFNNSIVPHAPYSVSKKLFELINEVSYNNILSIHNQETPTENEFLKNKTGDFLRLYENLGIDISSFVPTNKNSLQSWLPQLSNAKKIISVHNSFSNGEDIAFAKQFSSTQEMYYCLCPNANLYIENTLPSVEMFIKNNVNIVLGTDSYASNTHLNIFEEIKTIQKNFPEISLEKILQWATMNGAKALGLEGELGSFEKGKRSGAVLISNENSKRLF
jgi:aminodeoxyfutalosine deaminase